MRNRTLSKIGTRLLRLRHDSSQSSQDRAAPAGYGLGHGQVAEFIAGTLDAGMIGLMTGATARVPSGRVICPRPLRSKSVK